MADALPMMIAYVDAENRIRFTNEATADWFSRPRAELEGRRVAEILPEDIYARVRLPMAMAQAGERVDCDLVVHRPGESRRCVSLTLAPHVEERVVGFWAFVQDVTDRVRIQEELHRQHDQLAHASRVSTLGEMATALAHELNQPLTAVLSNAQAAQRIHAARPLPACSTTTEILEILDDVTRDATRAAEIIRRLRELVRRGDSRHAPLDVNLAIRGVETLVRAATLGGDVALQLDLAPHLAGCTGDVVQIQQVLLNLVRNGIEAMRPIPKTDRRIVIRSRPQGESVLVSVEDAGPPVGPDVLPQLFSPFFTTKENGLGMGLSISRSIIQAHHGSIRARRRRPRGLMVEFTLPAAHEAADRVTA
jgi:two-component system sensor kinase FixL